MQEQLVHQVKEIQRNDVSGKMAWWKYADEQGGSIRDPAKHEPSFLEYFINQYRAGLLPTGPTEAGKLGELFKDGQRNSPSFRQAWETFTRHKNLRMNDPTKNDKDTLIGFLEYLGQQGMMAMSMMDGGSSDGGVKGGYGKMDSGYGKGMDAGYGMDASYGKGMDASYGKGMGASYGKGMDASYGGYGKGMDSCYGKGMDGGYGKGMDGSYGGFGGYGNVDQSWGGMQSQGGGWGGNGGWGEPANKKPKMGTGDPQKDALVEKIKAFQRSGEEQKQAWWSFCDQQQAKFRDPARQDIETLQMFCTGYQLY